MLNSSMALGVLLLLPWHFGKTSVRFVGYYQNVKGVGEQGNAFIVSETAEASGSVGQRSRGEGWSCSWRPMRLRLLLIL